MAEALPVVSEFILSYKRNWEKNFKLDIDNRVDSALYFPVEGRLVFEGEFGKKICDREHPMYIPQKLNYIYRAEEVTNAYLFNFYDTNPATEPILLDFVDFRELENAHEQLNILRAVPTVRNKAKMLSVLYRIMGMAFPESDTPQNAILLPALEYVAMHFNDTGLTLDILAEKCHISKVYLHKLFVKKLGVTPFKYITNVRMERANILLKDRKPVGQVALEVGYNDIYTFSRAYKKHYGISPDKAKRSE